MAKIPRFFAGSRVTPGVVGIQEDPNLQAQLATSGDEGQTAFQAAKQFEVQAQVEEQKQREKDALAEKQYVIQSSLDYQNQVFNKTQELQKQFPDGPGYADALQQEMAGFADAVIAGAPSERAALTLQNKLGNFQLQAIQQANKFELGRVQDAQIARADETLAHLKNQTLVNPENTVGYLDQIDTVTQMLSDSGLDPVKVSSVRRKARSQVFDAALESNVNQGNIDGAVAAILNGDAIEASPQGIIRTLKAKQDQLQEQQLLELVSSGIPLNPGNKEHQAGVDKVFELQTKRALANEASPEDVRKLAVNTVKQYKIMPTVLKEKLVAGITNGGNAEKVRAAQTLIDIYQDPETRPTTDTISDKVFEEAYLISNSVNNGKSIEEATTNARSIVYEPRSDLREIRKEQLADIQKGFFSDVDLSLEGVEDILEDKFGVSDNLEEAVPEFRRAFEESFLRSGDADLAQEMALRQVQREFNVSSVNGGESLLRNPIEKTAKDTSHVEKIATILETIRQSDTTTGTITLPKEEDQPESPITFLSGGKPVDSISTTSDVSTLKIKPDTLTEKEGTYAVVTTNSFGYDEPVISSETGEVVRVESNSNYTTRDEIRQLRATERVRKERKEFEKQIEKTRANLDAADISSDQKEKAVQLSQELAKIRSGKSKIGISHGIAKAVDWVSGLFD